MHQEKRIWYQSFVDDEHGKVYWDHLREHLSAVTAPGTSVQVHGITPHDSYAHAIVEFRCAREVICNAVRAEREGYDAFVVGHFQDAGLYEARAVVDIPVLGLGEASMLYCCQLAQQIGIVTINERFIPWFHHQLGKYGLRERVTGVHAMSFEPGQILAAFGSAEKMARVKELFREQAEPLVQRGLQLLLPGGGIPMLLFANEHDHNVSGAPVVNGIEIVANMAEMAIGLQRRSGLGVSRTADYSKPPAAIVEEFLAHPKGL